MEQAEIKRLSKFFDLERRVQTAKTYLPTKQEYDLMRQNTPARLLQSDSLRILYGWLRYGYQDSLELCRWLCFIRSGRTFRSKSGVFESVLLICSLSCPAFNAI